MFPMFDTVLGDLGVHRRRQEARLSVIRSYGVEVASPDNDITRFDSGGKR
jgi:hypothetical protein